MAENNKQNLFYFESASMRGLFECMQDWQSTNQKRFLSTSIHQDGDKFCCIALTNPSEVVITSWDGNYGANVSQFGQLIVWDESGNRG